jgi:hypothetical protein
LHYISIALIKVHDMREILYMKLSANEELIGTVDVSQSGFWTIFKIVIKLEEIFHKVVMAFWT